jgi:GDPmannose 4,6-dehydratase
MGGEQELMGLQGDVDGLGTLRLLDAIRTCGLTHHLRFYQVSQHFYTRR